MKLFKSLPIFISVSLFIGLFCRYVSTANFEIRNDCLYTVWAASVPVGGGRRLDQGEAWNLNVSPGSKPGRIWGRTNCTFDDAGNGTCLTGDCNGKLQCTTFGSPPNTLAEYALNQFNNLDFFDISLVDGFNVPMEFSPVSTESKGCNLVEYTQNQYIGNDLYISVDEGINVQIGFGDSTTSTSSKCSRGVECSADINGECPNELKAPGGCNNPCTVFQTNQYCCNTGNCDATNYSKYFKNRCPDAYSYPKDDQTSTFTCPGGTNYRVVFCPISLNF